MRPQFNHLILTFVLIFAVQAVDKEDISKWFSDQAASVKEWGGQSTEWFKTAFEDSKHFLVNLKEDMNEFPEEAKTQLKALETDLKTASEEAKAAGAAALKEGKELSAEFKIKVTNAKEVLNRRFSEEFWKAQYKKMVDNSAERTAEVKAAYAIAAVSLQAKTDAINTDISSYSDKVVLRYQELQKSFKAELGDMKDGTIETANEIEKKWGKTMDEFTKMKVEAMTWKNMKADKLTGEAKTAFDGAKEKYGDFLQDVQFKRDEWSEDVVAAYKVAKESYTDVSAATAETGKDLTTKMNTRMAAFKSAYDGQFNDNTEDSSPAVCRQLAVTLLFLSLLSL